MGFPRAGDEMASAQLSERKRRICVLGRGRVDRKSDRILHIPTFPFMIFIHQLGFRSEPGLKLFCYESSVEGVKISTALGRAVSSCWGGTYRIRSSASFGMDFQIPATFSGVRSLYSGVRSFYGR